MKINSRKYFWSLIAYSSFKTKSDGGCQEHVDEYIDFCEIMILLNELYIDCIVEYTFSAKEILAFAI